jgi:hypothetical protein
MCRTADFLSISKISKNPQNSLKNPQKSPKVLKSYIFNIQKSPKIHKKSSNILYNPQKSQKCLNSTNISKNPKYSPIKPKNPQKSTDPFEGVRVVWSWVI